MLLDAQPLIVDTANHGLYHGKGKNKGEVAQL